eukprot:Nk52_evm3s62 gene=Nk52_evmTU3s62
MTNSNPSAELTCYNKSCGLKYVESDNHSSACRYHPGEPVFHDALKGWSCCDKRYRDFQDFMGIPGCATGRHSNEKPAPKGKSAAEGNEEAEKARAEQEAAEKARRLEKKLAEERDAAKVVSLDMIEVPVKITKSAERAWEPVANRLKELSLKSNEQQGSGAVGDKSACAKDEEDIKEGTTCRNNACGKSYSQQLMKDCPVCKYHPGGPVFHETAKFWSCCKKKVFDFDDFLKLPGCTEGTHKWSDDEKNGEKGSSSELKPVECRIDWYQTETCVNVSIFAKKCNPSAAKVKLSGKKLDVYLELNGDSVCSIQKGLFGEVDQANSTAELLGTKLELSLKKLRAQAWSKLETEG